MNRIWPGAVVMENTLQVHAGAIRKALGPYRGVLKTESRRGYRLLGNWTTKSRDAPNSPSENVQVRDSDKLALTNFPIATAPLIGRSATTLRLLDLLSAYRIVTLTGPGGIGKTALALQLGRHLLSEFADGCWLVELATLSNPALVPSAAASVLGLTLFGDSTSSATIAGAIGQRHMLLILDNCEHVIGAAAELVEAIISQCPNTTLLTTSREILRANGEHVYRVPPLDIPAEETSGNVLDHSAIAFFVARANAFDVNYTPSADDLPLIANICRRLDGIPLAIEFAAARKASLGLAHLAAGLDSLFSLLTSGRRTALPRHRTLRATLDWSFDLLMDGERELLCHLAVFRAGFTLESAVAVNGGESTRLAVMNGIASLIDKSLVVVDAFQAGSRWRLLETIRSYALDRLAERGDADGVARRHAGYFRDLVASALPDFASSLPADELALYGREVDNVRAALDWSFSAGGNEAIGIELTAAYAPFLMHFSLVSECRIRCEQALNLIDAGAHLDARLQVLLQLNLGVSLVHTSGHSAQTQTILARALKNADSLGNLQAQVLALLFLHGVHWYRGEYAEMATATDRLTHIARQIDDPFTVNVVDRHLGDTLMTAGRLSEAQQCLERVVQFAHVDGQRVPVWRRRSADHAKARTMLARALWLKGFPDTAKDEALASLDEVQGADHLTICLVLHFGLCKIAPMTGDFATTEWAITRLSEAAASMDSRFWTLVVQLYKGKFLADTGEFSKGVIALRQALKQCSETGWRPSYPVFRGSLALALRELGQFDEAASMASEAMAAASQRNDGRHWYAPELLRIEAEISSLQSGDRPALAEGYLARALKMAQNQGARAWELRIALSLARLRSTQGRRGEARQTLAAIYQSFTEGFSTLDLKEAQRLLAML